ncbi:MAG TPA: hypothetical protein VGO90_11855 [Chthoniobacteraceae bacterium]|jgi:hypothetical protein|nr:hypothetical protein [Chthoniobacter sp.]HEV7868369.1 hypothetical protein [Chthoniobacteraceae bacterium]
MKSSANDALISPDAEGWRLRHGNAAARNFPTLGEAAAALPLKTAVRLALPCQIALIERIKLPATDREELAGMLALQFEKTLPYPTEEVSSDFEVIESAEHESTLLAVAAHRGQLDELCGPLLAQARLPEKITLFAMHVAAVCPADQTVLAIYAEQGQFVAAICERGKLSWAQTLSGIDAAALTEELPQLLLSAEIDGVPTNFASVQLERSFAQLTEPLREQFGVPVQLIALDVTLPEPSGNLVPAAWQADARRLKSGERLQQRLLLGAVLYLLLVAGAFVYLAWLKNESQKLAMQVAATQPQLKAIQESELRWNELRPAFDPSRSTIEILHQIHKNLPSAEVLITEFEHSPSQWKVVGEAPSAILAIEYVQKLKGEKELEAWTITSGEPDLLPNEHAKFSVFGRL